MEFKDWLLLVFIIVYLTGSISYIYASFIANYREMGLFEAIGFLPLCSWIYGMFWPVCEWPLTSQRRMQKEREEANEGD